MCGLRTSLYFLFIKIYFQALRILLCQIKHYQIGKGQAHIQKKEKNSYSGQGDLELILGSRQLLNLRIIHSSCKTRFINVEKEITLNKFT